jgi:uncharacterized protein YecT (DUF1311 family)
VRRPAGYDLGAPGEVIGRLAVLLLASALPAGAQDAAQALPAVRACLESDAPQACAGDFARTCMQASPQGETTVGMSVCALTEAEAWDQVLNETYAALLKTAPPESAAMLRAAQRAWVAFRDADCAQEVAIWGEGSMRQIAGAECTLARTAQRVTELRDKRAALEN